MDPGCLVPDVQFPGVRPRGEDEERLGWVAAEPVDAVVVLDVLDFK